MTSISHDAFIKELLSDPEVRAAYDEMKPEFELIAQMLEAKRKAGMNQKDIAKAMKTSASAVSRLESSLTNDKHSPSLSTIKKYVKTLGYRLEIKLKPIREA